MTFGRMATGELRARVRERLVSAEAGLARAAHGVAPAPADEVLDAPRAPFRTTSWSGGRPGSPGRSPTSTPPRSPRRTGSASRCSSGIGVAGDVDRDVTFVEDLDRPRRRGGRRPLPPQVRRAVADRRVRPDAGAAASPATVVDQPAAAIVPAARARAVRRGDALPAGAGGARRGRAPQAAHADPHLRRPADPPRPPRCAIRMPRARLRDRVPGRDGRRVPGHRPGAVGHRPHARSATAAPRSC